MQERIKNRLLAVGTLNVRGIKEKWQQQVLAEDLSKYKIKIAAIQEHHLKGTGIINNLKGNNKKDKYKLFYTGPENNKNHGIAIATHYDIKAEYKTISDRIVVATFNLNQLIQAKERKEHRKVVFIAAYFRK